MKQCLQFMIQFHQQMNEVWWPFTSKVYLNNCADLAQMTFQVFRCTSISCNARLKGSKDTFRTSLSLRLMDLQVSGKKVVCAMSYIQISNDTIDPSIEVEVDYPSKYEDKMMSILDMKMKMNSTNEVVYCFHRKPPIKLIHDDVKICSP